MFYEKNKQTLYVIKSEPFTGPDNGLENVLEAKLGLLLAIGRKASDGIFYTAGVSNSAALEIENGLNECSLEAFRRVNRELYANGECSMYDLSMTVEILKRLREEGYYFNFDSLAMKGKNSLVFAADYDGFLMVPVGNPVKVDWEESAKMIVDCNEPENILDLRNYDLNPAPFVARGIEFYLLSVVNQGVHVLISGVMPKKFHENIDAVLGVPEYEEKRRIEVEYV